MTADRIEEPLGQTGASVTIIPAAEVEKLGSKGLADVLRGVAGLDVDEAGGVGSVTEVRLRGSNPGETLVLIDGVRIGNPSSTDGSLDFGNLSAVDIERIEVLRGPQSALYGSDAMGGVINIITRKGGKTPHRSVTVEAGSYGTISTRATMSGGDDVWTYSLGVNALHTDGFPRYGYRIDRPITIGDGVTPLPPLPADDPTNKGGHERAIFLSPLRGRHDRRRLLAVRQRGAFRQSLRDDRIGDVFSHYNVSQTTVADGFVRATADSFGGLLRSQLTVFSNVTTSDIWETEGCYDAFFNAFNCRSGYQGARTGAEYQGDLKLGAFGALTLGARTETETASTSQSPNPDDGSFTPIRAQQTTNSVFAEHRLTLFDRLDLTLGGRVDAIESGQTFETWRATAAYRIDETGTKLRASVGTGDKAATLYQRFSQYGDPTFGAGAELRFRRRDRPEALQRPRHRVGDGFRHPLSRPDRLRRCSLVHARADQGRRRLLLQRRPRRDQGRRTLGRRDPRSRRWRAKASYTYLDARDLETDTQLLQRPRNKGALSLDL